MTDPTNDIDSLLGYLSLAADHSFTTIPSDVAAIYHAALTALVAERDALREQLRLANIDQFNTEAELNDCDRDLRERLVCAALTGACSLEGWVRLEDLANHAVGAAEATLAAMRKGDGDGK